MKVSTHPIYVLAAAVLAAFASPEIARGQSAIQIDPLPPDMKPYTETIPGTKISFEMIPIPGGTFTIGSPEDEEGRGDDEGPQRTITIAPFWMGKCEVTWEEYDPFAFSLDIKRKKSDGVNLDTQPDTEKKADAVTRPTPPYADETFGYGRKGQPAICITHHAVLEYTRWLSAKTGKHYRLPTEAEWEYAARAGTSTPYSFGDDPSQLDDYAWYVENAEKPMPVGKKKPNPWGLHDMHGNVAEWVIDHYVADQYEKYPEDSAEPNPVVMPDDKEYPYIVRGGSWDDDPEMLRSAARRASNKEWSVQDPQRPQSIWWHTDATFVGFRVIRPYDPDNDKLRDFASPIVKKQGTK